MKMIGLDQTGLNQLIQKGYNILADPEKNDAILNSIDKQLQKKIDNITNPLYGDGHTSDQIVREIINSC